MAQSGSGEVVLVLVIKSFTPKGFVASSTFGGREFQIDFDNEDRGVTLTGEMCAKIHVRKGSAVKVLEEDEEGIRSFDTVVASVGDDVRLSNPDIYYLVGRAGGGIVRFRKP